jgi:4-amino-4-deoxy-L-arabinose transferase-like glycosyltransferase
VVILLINNWAMPLWDQDEAAYAGFGKTMIEEGDFVIPDYYFSHDHRKTPLHFWDIALSFMIFGYNEFAVRFPSFLAILGTLLLVLYQTRKWLGLDVAYKATVVLGTSILVTSLAKVSVTDATLLFFSTLSGFALINTLFDPKFKWGLYFYLGIALGLLTKGPPIIIFVGGFAGLLFLFHPNRFNLLKLHPWFFLPVAFLPVVGWGYLTVQVDGGDFLNWMYDWYVKRRVSGAVYGQSGPPGMHLGLMFGFFLLSAMYFFQGFADGIKSFFKEKNHIFVFGAWLVAGWLIYEFSPSKLPAYVIPAHVAIAILIGHRISNYEQKKLRPHIGLTGLHFVLNIGLAVGLIIASKFVAINDGLTIALIAIGVLYLLAIVFQLLWFKSRKFFLIQGFSSVLLLVALWTVAPLFSQHINSSEKVSEYVLAEIEPGAPVIIGYAPGMQPSLPFYLSQKDNPIIVEFATPQITHIYDSVPAGAFILNANQDSVFRLKYPNYTSEVITSKIIDRKDIATYYVHIKK